MGTLRKKYISTFLTLYKETIYHRPMLTHINLPETGVSCLTEDK